MRAATGQFLASDGSYSLSTNGCLTSSNGGCQFCLQNDANLVLYRGGTVLWASNTANAAQPMSLDMQPDGNLVAYGTTGAFWSTNTQGRQSSPYTAIVRDNCDFMVLSSDGTAIWRTNTAQAGRYAYPIVRLGGLKVLLK